MSSRMLIIVDVQNDFCEGGALGVSGGAEVARRIAARVRDRAGDYDRILVTQDWHRGDTDNGGHFAVPPEEPDFSDTWPVHCVAGTDGAALHPAIADLVAELGQRAERVHKGYGVPSYSALEGAVVGTGTLEEDVPEQGEDVQSLIADGDWVRVDVVGLAYDFCVRETALGAAAAGAPVRVIRDLTAAVHPDGTAALEHELSRSGIEVADA